MNHLPDTSWNSATSQSFGNTITTKRKETTPQKSQTVTQKNRKTSTKPELRGKGDPNKTCL